MAVIKFSREEEEEKKEAAPEKGMQIHL